MPSAALKVTEVILKHKITTYACLYRSAVTVKRSIVGDEASPQGLGASEKKNKKKILYNTTRGRTHLLPFF